MRQGSWHAAGHHTSRVEHIGNAMHCSSPLSLSSSSSLSMKRAIRIITPGVRSVHKHERAFLGRVEARSAQHYKPAYV